MAMTSRTAVLFINCGIVETTVAVVTWSFSKGDWEIGTRIDRTLKACSVTVGVHPKIARVAAKLVLGAIKTIILTEVLG